MIRPTEWGEKALFRDKLESQKTYQRLACGIGCEGGRRERCFFEDRDCGGALCRAEPASELLCDKAVPRARLRPPKHRVFWGCHCRLVQQYSSVLASLCNTSALLTQGFTSKVKASVALLTS